MDTFKAFRIHKQDKGVVGRLEALSRDDLNPGDVLIRSHYSSINYKDALAATGAARIMKRLPLVGGIDVAGEVVESSDERYGPGDRVLITGCGLGEEYDGGFAEYVRAHGDWVIPIPEGLDVFQAMALGTAGFTAGLAVHRMEQNGQQPDQGPVVVTGATGGVGSLVIDMLGGLGYEVVALTGKPGSTEYLRELGASSVLDRREIDFGRAPLEKTLWAGAVDNLGGETLTWLTRTMGFWGNIASIGLAASHELHTTVMPFILRGVNLLGINSVYTPREWRLQVWDRLATDLRPRHLENIVTRSVSLGELADVFQEFVDGQVTGRTVVAMV